MLLLALCGFRQGRSDNCHRRRSDSPTPGDTDRAIAQFRSPIQYKIAPFSAERAAVGEPLLAAGFPASAEVLAVVREFVELLLPKSLPQGYSLGYTNEVKIGISGGSIFNASLCF